MIRSPSFWYKELSVISYNNLQRGVLFKYETARQIFDLKDLEACLLYMYAWEYVDVFIHRVLYDDGYRYTQVRFEFKHA